MTTLQKITLTIAGSDISVFARALEFAESQAKEAMLSDLLAGLEVTPMGSSGVVEAGPGHIHWNFRVAGRKASAEIQRRDTIFKTTSVPVQDSAEARAMLAATSADMPKEHIKQLPKDQVRQVLKEDFGFTRESVRQDTDARIDSTVKAHLEKRLNDGFIEKIVKAELAKALANSQWDKQGLSRVIAQSAATAFQDYVANKLNRED